MSDDVAEGVVAGDAIAIARALVGIPSVNPVLEPAGGGEREIAEATCSWLKQWGFTAHTAEVAPGRWNTIGHLEGPGQGPTLLLNGHLDTVGVEGMTIDPFSAEVVDGRMWGRGSCDMKGGDASLLAAAAALARDGLSCGRLVVALTADEEHASLGMQSLIESGVRADAAIVCEPTDLAVMPAHKGFVWIEHVFTGRAAHGSRPEVGIDAIEHAGRYLSLFGDLRENLRTTSASNGSVHPLLGQGSFHAGTIQGGVAASVYPAECRLVVERRTVPGETDAQVMAEFRGLAERAAALIPDLSLEVTQGLTRPATEVSAESPLVQGLLRALAGRGLDPSVEPMTAWVDAAFLNEAGIPAVCFGPGSIAQAHSVDEWIEVVQIEHCARVIEDFARSFLDGGGV
jgi:acetylornithine deacetylase